MKYPYGLLGIGEDASGKEIRQAYLERLKAYPPEYCGEKFQELNDAYRLLENDLEKAKLNVFGIPQSNPDGGNNVESSCRRRRFGLPSGNGFLAESSEDGSIGMSDSENWKEKLCREFREWLDYLEEEPLPLEEDDSAPDMLTFFCELAALRQEVGLQTRGIRKNSQEMQETLSVLKESLANGSSELKTVLQEVKSQIPQTRSMAEDTVLSELFRLREALSENVLQFSQRRLCGLFASRKDAAMLQEAQRNQELLLKKADDILRRFDVAPVAEIGDAFNASEMRAVTSVKDAEVPPGCVSKIYMQGFRRKEKLLSAAEVEVRSL